MTPHSMLQWHQQRCRHHGHSLVVHLVCGQPPHVFSFHLAKWWPPHSPSSVWPLCSAEQAQSAQEGAQTAHTTAAAVVLQYIMLTSTIAAEQHHFAEANSAVTSSLIMQGTTPTQPVRAHTLQVEGLVNPLWWCPALHLKCSLEHSSRIHTLLAHLGTLMCVVSLC